jgi:hypothetical protein
MVLHKDSDAGVVMAVSSRSLRDVISMATATASSAIDACK